MDDRKSIDAELHTLRSCIRGCEDSRQRSEMEGARFQIYAAFEHRDPDAARRWAKALRAALIAVDHDELRGMGLDALGVIESAIGDGGGAL
jgi:hypothetical protein